MRLTIPLYQMRLVLWRPPDGAGPAALAARWLASLVVESAAARKARKATVSCVKKKLFKFYKNSSFTLKLDKKTFGYLLFRTISP